MLGCIPVPVKPLREQREDIVPSAGLYIDTLNQELGRQVVGLDEGASELLKDYSYPCNRTQFKRILKKAVLETSTAYISAETIEKILKEESSFFAAPALSPAEDETPAAGFRLNLELPLDEMNRQIIRQVLRQTGGNQSAAAKRLGISRTTLWRYLKD